ncbi:MAG: hypothetical protein ABSE67_13895 [Xanthobacteraceae bacterium]|jgi:hypothetical protein
MIYGVSIFCDDIRFEQQNKISLVGCYGPEMVVYSAPPFVLPKLGILLQARFPMERLPSVHVKIYMPEEEEPFFTQEISKEEEHFVPRANAFKPEKPEDLNILRGLAFPFLFSPFIIQKEGHIRVRLLFGSEIVRVGGLRVISQVPQALPPASSDLTAS